jgi:hypothetical protein
MHFRAGLLFWMPELLVIPALFQQLWAYLVEVSDAGLEHPFIGKIRWEEIDSVDLTRNSARVVGNSKTIRLYFSAFKDSKADYDLFVSKLKARGIRHVTR